MLTENVADAELRLEIRFQVDCGPCQVCGEPAAENLAVPMWEGFVLPNDWTGEWCGFRACDSCYEKQGRLTAPADAQSLAVSP